MNGSTNEFFLLIIFLDVVHKKYDFSVICCQYPFLPSFSLVPIVRPMGRGGGVNLCRCVTTTLICSGGLTSRLSKLKPHVYSFKGRQIWDQNVYALQKFKKLIFIYLIKLLNWIISSSSARLLPDKWIYCF